MITSQPRPRLCKIYRRNFSIARFLRGMILHSGILSPRANCAHSRRPTAARAKEALMRARAFLYATMFSLAGCVPTVALTVSAPAALATASDKNDLVAPVYYRGYGYRGYR